jgi:hypothetical protein
MQEPAEVLSVGSCGADSATRKACFVDAKENPRRKFEVEGGKDFSAEFTEDSHAELRAAIT